MARRTLPDTERHERAVQGARWMVRRGERPGYHVVEGGRRPGHDGSLGGAPQDPAWYHNLKHHPHVELQDGPTRRDYAAREMTADEKAIWWERAVEAWPDYEAYQRKTDRQIPVFVLDPITET